MSTTTTTTTMRTNQTGNIADQLNENSVKDSSNDTINMNNNDINIVEIIKYLPRECIKCDGPDCNVYNPRHRCSKCYCNYYCSTTCQKNDWKNHKQYCISIDDMKNKHEQILYQRNEYMNNNNILDININKNKILLANNNDNNTSYQQDDECSICLEKPMKNPTYLKECNHKFCSSCILQWQQYRKLMADLIVNFDETTPTQQSQDDDITKVQVKRNTLNCPICRTETNDDIEENLMKHAMLLATRASCDTIKSNIVIRETLLREALSYLNQVLDTDLPIISAYFTKAEILLELNEPNNALETINILLQIDNERKQHPVMLLIDEQDNTVINKNYIRYEQLKEEIVIAAEQYGMPSTRLRNDAYYHTYNLQIQCYEKLKQWNDVLDTYKKVGIYMDNNDNDGITNSLLISPQQQRSFYYGLGKCLYELNRYEHCIDMLNIAIEMNRHYPEVHIYKAYSQEKLCHVDDAVITMNCATLYETPWDIMNQKSNYIYYQQLLLKLKQKEQNEPQEQQQQKEQEQELDQQQQVVENE